MLELTGKQIETLCTGLQDGFGEPIELEIFLRHKLNKHYNDYVAERDSFRTACFKIVNSSAIEEWLDELITESIKARPKNPHIARIGRQLGLIAGEHVSEAWSLEESATADEEPPRWRTYNPYRGMLALREQDADYLFGRDQDVDRFINAIEMEPSKILLALGASGIGKSSLIFAGVLAALRRRSRKTKKPWPVALEDSHKWQHIVLTPEAEPVYSLAGAFVRQWIDETEPDFRERTNKWRELLTGGDSLTGLVRAADASWRRKGDPPPRYLIYVDQSEELYTRGGREPGLDYSNNEKLEQKEARRFSELLAEAAAHPRLIVLMTARSDFLGQLQADKRLSDGHPAKIFDVVHKDLDILPLYEDGLNQVITRPAEMLGVAFENGLDRALARATREETGGLPLLSYTLEALWQEMQNREDCTPVLRWGGPEGEAIDIAKKLADRADAFVQRHKPQEPTLRRLFCVWLADVPVQGNPTRKRAFIDDLSPEERGLVQELAGPEQRIIVTSESEGRAVAELAHEAFLTAWTTLRQWINERRSFYSWKTQIEAERTDWEALNYARSALLTGRPLDRARTFMDSDEEDIPEKDMAFVHASIKAAEDQQARDEERAQQQNAAELRAERLARENAELRAEQLENYLSATRGEAETLRIKTREQAARINFLEVFEKILASLIILALLLLIIYLSFTDVQISTGNQVSTNKHDRENSCICPNYGAASPASMSIRQIVRKLGLCFCHDGKTALISVRMSLTLILRDLGLCYCSTVRQKTFQFSHSERPCISYQRRQLDHD